MSFDPHEDKQVGMVGGVNLLSDPLRISDNECVKLKNLYPNAAGKMAKRLGPAYYARNETGMDQSNYLPLNFFFPKFHPGGMILLSYDTTTRLMYLSAGDVNVAGWGAGVTLPEAPPFYRPQMMEFGGKVLIALGTVDAAGIGVYEVSDVDGLLTISASPITFLDSDGNSLSPRALAAYQGRVVYMNFGPKYNDLVVFADADLPYKINSGDIDTDAGLITSRTIIVDTDPHTLRVRQMAGDSIIGASDMVVSPEGSPDEEALLLLGGHTAIVMPGTPLETDQIPNASAGETYAGTLAPKRVNFPCGCVSPDTIVRTPMGIIWATWDDVWAIDVGGIPHRIGTKLRPALSAGQPLCRYWWHAAYHHGTGSYRLAIVSGEQFPDTSSGLIVEACRDQWWVDLRFGIPPDATTAHWFGPQQYRMQQVAQNAPAFPGTFYMRTEEREGAPARSLAVHVMNDYPTFAGTRIPVVVELDRTTGYDLAVVIGTAADHSEILANEMNANEISYEIITKEYSFDSPMSDKIFERAEMMLWSSDVLEQRMEVIVDGGRDTDTQAVQLDQTGFVAGVDLLGSRLTHEYQMIAMNPDGDKRMTGKILQFRFYDVAGVPVPENGINSGVMMADLLGDAIITAIPIPPGFYASTNAFIFALITAMNAALIFTREGFIFTYGTNGSNIFRITETFYHGEWAWTMDLGDNPPSEDIRRSKKVAGLLGFPTDLNLDDVGTGIIAATLATPIVVSPQVEIAGIVIRAYHFNRRPSGEKNENKIP